MKQKSKAQFFMSLFAALIFMLYAASAARRGGYGSLEELFSEKKGADYVSEENLYIIKSAGEFTKEYFDVSVSYASQFLPRTIKLPPEKAGEAVISSLRRAVSETDLFFKNVLFENTQRTE